MLFKFDFAYLGVLKLIGLAAIAFFMVLAGSEMLHEHHRRTARIVRVCNLETASSCNCVDSELVWRDGLVLCVEKK